MKHKILMLLLMFGVVTVVGSMLFLPKQDIEILGKKDSGIKDFYIDNGNVYIVTGVTIKNNTKNTVKFMLTGESKIDYESGLITSPILQGYDETVSTKEFSIGGNEKATFNVIFVGKHGTNNQKANRLDPKISASIIKIN